jgi:hypothetical protein
MTHNTSSLISSACLRRQTAITSRHATATPRFVRWMFVLLSITRISLSITQHANLEQIGDFSLQVTYVGRNNASREHVIIILSWITWGWWYLYEL